ncbi:MAG: hypothetical protein L0177_06075, partial [Chloroflexi bacterium]|nr:hypothetical protein [Chloroflexota bacterium]
VEPALYAWIRPALFLYASASVLGAVALLLAYGNALVSLPNLRQQSPTTRQQAKVALAGIVLGLFPFVGLTLIPEALGQRTLLPIHLTVLAVVFMPALFAYAILQYQLMGIRKLVHRGMVYGITTVALLTIILVGVALAFELVAENSTRVEDFPIPVIAGIAVAGILLFHPLRKGARWLVDRLIYGDVVDYRQLVEAMRRDLLGPGQTREVAEGITAILRQALQLESVLLFLGRGPDKAQLVAVDGKRGEEVLKDFYPDLETRLEESDGAEMMELRWEADSMLFTPLALPGKYCGYMVLGPKHNGEVFLEEEKQLISAMIPLFALTIDKSQLSEELRELNQRIIKAEEVERARIAIDIHDGPLQKAVLLTGAGGSAVGDSRELARFLVSELREICSRLRPAILDDLGVVAALEWQLEQIASRHGLLTRLTLNNVSEADRFPPDVELAIFRVTQEATNNAVKHAMCKNLEVRLSREGNNLALVVSDDGVGFALAPQSDGGLGISGMNERVMQLNGAFNIFS